jgi:long-chain acyl-CoA synthetase
VGYEIPMKLRFTFHPFSVENDLLTPTFKFKRFEAKHFFLSEIKTMYGSKLQGE